MPPLAPFLLTGCRLERDDDDGLVLDDWLAAATCPRSAGNLVCQVRDRIDARIADLLRGGGKATDDDGGALQDCVEALVALEARPELKATKAKPNSKKKRRTGRNKSRRRATVAHSFRPGGAFFGSDGGGFDW